MVQSGAAGRGLWQVQSSSPWLLAEPRPRGVTERCVAKAGSRSNRRNAVNKKTHPQGACFFVGAAGRGLRQAQSSSPWLLAEPRPRGVTERCVAKAGSRSNRRNAVNKKTHPQGACFFVGAAGRGLRQAQSSSPWLLAEPRPRGVTERCVAKAGSRSNRRNAVNKKTHPQGACFFVGAAGRTRTDTVSLPLDFESSASANFTTAAYAILINYNIKPNVWQANLPYIFILADKI